MSRFLTISWSTKCTASERERERARARASASKPGSVRERTREQASAREIRACVSRDIVRASARARASASASERESERPQRPEASSRREPNRPSSGTRLPWHRISQCVAVAAELPSLCTLPLARSEAQQHRRRDCSHHRTNGASDLPWLLWSLDHSSLSWIPFERHCPHLWECRHPHARARSSLRGASHSELAPCVALTPLTAPA